MATGKVKWFNNAKGYGFIRPDMGGDDLFVHYSYIEMEGYKSLKAGQVVEYEIREAPKGLHAVNIRYDALEHPLEEENDISAGFTGVNDISLGASVAKSSEEMTQSVPA